MPKPTDLCAFGIGNNMEVVQAPQKYSNKFGISFDLHYLCSRFRYINIMSNVINYLLNY